MPDAPAASASSAQQRAFSSPPIGARHTDAKASACRQSPASVATVSPKAMWQAGFPRRVSSLSMQGRSS